MVARLSSVPKAMQPPSAASAQTDPTLAASLSAIASPPPTPARVAASPAASQRRCFAAPLNIARAANDLDDAALVAGPVAVAQQALVELAGGQSGQLIGEVDGARALHVR